MQPHTPFNHSRSNHNDDAPFQFIDELGSENPSSVSNSSATVVFFTNDVQDENDNNMKKWRILLLVYLSTSFVHSIKHKMRIFSFFYNGRTTTDSVTGVIAKICLDLLRHAIPHSVESDVELLETLNDCVQKREMLQPCTQQSLKTCLTLQVLGSCSWGWTSKFDFRPTVTNMLKLRDPENPLLYNAR